MRALTAADILSVWESARGRHPVDQALTLLAAADPQYSRDELASLPLGERDARLIALRRSLFGDRLPGRAQCPQCGEAVEFELSCNALSDTPSSGVQKRTLSVGGYTLELLPLDSHALAAAVRACDVDQAQRALLSRCVHAARRGELLIGVEDLPENVIDAVSQDLAANDPQAEFLISLACPGCQHQWRSVLEIAQLLWAELDALAQRLLMEVHALARVYGWREAEILALSPARRAAYLQMVAA